MRSRRAAWLRWSVVLVAAAAIFWESSRPVPAGLMPPIPQSDKLAHALAYAVFAMLVFRALVSRSTGIPACAGESQTIPTRRDDPQMPKKALVLGVILASLYGASDELHQHFVPCRSCDVFDWLADTGGAAAAALAWPWLTRRFPRLK